MDVEISIIVPVYNIEQLLVKFESYRCPKVSCDYFKDFQNFELCHFFLLLNLIQKGFHNV